MQKTLLILFLFYSFLAKSQEQYLNYIDRSQGLPSNTIYDIFQDRQGFIWLGTDEGLCRYDGRHFKSYPSTSLTSAAGSEIKQDKSGKIWYENFDGYLYYIERDSLKKLECHEPVGYFDYHISENRIIIIAKGGLAIYDTEKLKLIRKIPMDVSKISYCRDVKNQLYIFSNQISVYDNEGEKVREIDYHSTNEEIHYVGLAAELNRKTYFISMFNFEGKCYYENESHQISEAFELTQTERIQNLCSTGDQLWFCTKKGVYVYSENEKEIQWKLRNSNVTTVFKDRENRIWIGTEDQGIIQMDKSNSSVLIADENLKKIAVRGNQIYCLAGERKLNVYDLSTQKYDEILGEFPDIFLESGEYSSNIYSSGSYFKIINEKNESVYQNDFAIKDFMELDSAFLVYAASGMISIHSIKNTDSPWNKIFTKANQKIDLNSRLDLKTNIRAKSLAMEKGSNEFYCAANLGTFRFSSDGTITEILWNGRTLHLRKISYYGNKLIGLDQNNQLNLITLTGNKAEKKNLLKNISQFYLFDNLLVVQDFQSLAVYEIGTDYQLTYQQSISTSNDQIKDVAYSNGQLYFVSEIGLVKWSLANEKKARTFIKFYTESLSAKGKLFSDGAVLSENQNDIEIGFSVLDYSGNHHHQVQFRINDGEWKDISSDERVLRLSSLSGGEYAIDFQLDGKIIQNASVAFEIAIPFWKRSWVLIILFVLLVVLVIIYFRWQLLLLKRKNELQLQKLELEKDLNKSILTSIKAQMNPHFFYNSLNTIQSYIFENDRVKASLYLGKFSKLTRIILEMSEREKISLKEECEALNLYLEIEKVRFSDDLDFVITMDSTKTSENIKIPPMIIQPFVENAIKHGLLHKKGKKILELTFEKEENYLQVKVDDNGIGRAKSEEFKKNLTNHNSFSTQATEKRLSILNHSKEAHVNLQFIDKVSPDGTALGTTVIFRIPL